MILNWLNENNLYLVYHIQFMEGVKIVNPKINKWSTSLYFKKIITNYRSNLKVG